MDENVLLKKKEIKIGESTLIAICRKCNGSRRKKHDQLYHKSRRVFVDCIERLGDMSGIP